MEEIWNGQQRLSQARDDVGQSISPGSVQASRLLNISDESQGQRVEISSSVNTNPSQPRSLLETLTSLQSKASPMRILKAAAALKASASNDRRSASAGVPNTSNECQTGEGSGKKQQGVSTEASSYERAALETALAKIFDEIRQADQADQLDLKYHLFGVKFDDDALPKKAKRAWLRKRMGNVRNQRNRASSRQSRSRSRSPDRSNSEHDSEGEGALCRLI